MFKSYMESKGYKVVEIPNLENLALPKTSSRYDWTLRYNVNGIQLIIDLDNEQIKISDYMEVYTPKQIRTFINDLKSYSDMQVIFRNKIK